MLYKLIHACRHFYIPHQTNIKLVSPITKLVTVDADLVVDLRTAIAEHATCKVSIKHFFDVCREVLNVSEGFAAAGTPCILLPVISCHTGSKSASHTSPSFPNIVHCRVFSYYKLFRA